MVLADAYTVSGTGTAWDGVYNSIGSNQFQKGSESKYLFFMNYDAGSRFTWALNTSYITSTSGDIATAVEYYDTDYKSSSSLLDTPDVGSWALGTASGAIPIITAGAITPNKSRGFLSFF